MRSDRQEGLNGQVQEQRIALRVATTHQNDHFMIQLERIRLEFNALQALKSDFSAKTDRNHSLQVVQKADYRQLASNRGNEITHLYRTRSRSLMIG